MWTIKVNSPVYLVLPCMHYSMQWQAPYS